MSEGAKRDDTELASLAIVDPSKITLESKVTGDKVCVMESEGETPLILLPAARGTSNEVPSNFIEMRLDALSAVPKDLVNLAKARPVPVLKERARKALFKLEKASSESEALKGCLSMRMPNSLDFYGLRGDEDNFNVYEMYLWFEGDPEFILPAATMVLFAVSDISCCVLAKLGEIAFFSWIYAPYILICGVFNMCCYYLSLSLRLQDKVPFLPPSHGGRRGGGGGGGR